MNEIYWITRLDDLKMLLCGIITLSVTTSFVCIILYFVGEEGGWDGLQTFKKIVKWSFPIFIISSILCAFTPTKEDMFLIYGIGGTIDYVKQNDKAKQLPDKCINALDAWVDTLNPKQVKK